MAWPWPAATELICACSSGGGGALDHAGQQCCSAIQEEARRVPRAVPAARTAPGGGRAARGPRSARPDPGCVAASYCAGVFGELGGPAEAERAVDQGLVADRGVERTWNSAQPSSSLTCL